MRARTGAMPPRNVMLRSNIRRQNDLRIPAVRHPHTADRTAVPGDSGP